MPAQDVAYVESLLTPGWGRPGKQLEEPRGLVIHWTADLRPGADAPAVRNWFEHNRRYKVSAHYVVDDRYIVQCVPEAEISYHSGESRKDDARKLLGSCPNRHSLSVEWCVNSDGNGAATYQNVVGLCGDICARYHWGTSSLLRHYDITGKHCPAFFVDDEWAEKIGFASGAAEAWRRFQRDVTVAARAAQLVGILPEGR